MIPESSLRKILEEALDQIQPGMQRSQVPDVAQKLAHFITKKSYTVMKEEKAPAAALLRAACIVLTEYVKEGNDLKIVLSVLGIVLEDAGCAVAGNTLAEVLIQFAESTT